MCKSPKRKLILNRREMRGLTSEIIDALEERDLLGESAIYDDTDIFSLIYCRIADAIYPQPKE